MLADPLGWREEEENQLLVVPVVVHLFQTEGDEAPFPGSAVRQALTLLNDGFRYRGAFGGGPFFSNAGIDGVDTAIEFRLADTRPDGSPTGGIERHLTSLIGRPIDAAAGDT